MSNIDLNQRLSPLFHWHPWPPGDPAPEIWRIIEQLDKRWQVQIAGAILDTQIAAGKAHLEGLQQIREIVGKAK
jgi:hypothetical protein